LNRNGGLKMERVFFYFKEIAKIPHGSGNTKAISDYCVEFARKNGLWYKQDEYNNIIIKKKASKGYEKFSPVIMQGHLDMVCDKNDDCDIDFLKDGLRLKQDGNFLYAEGTTLGGDDGIALAYILALLESDSIPHPEIEAVFTVDEETGMNGAKMIDVSDIKGNMLLNIDSEDEGIFLAGCAGGMDISVEIPLTFENMPMNQGYKIEVSGLIGGHSGVEIDKERGNAIVIMARLLNRLKDIIGICDINGGIKHNAIPNKCTAVILCSKEDELYKRIDGFKSDIYPEYEVSDPGLNIAVCKINELNQAVTWASAERLITFIINVPHGVVNMSSDIKGLVETSVNLSFVSIDDNLKVEFSVRSSKKTRKNYMFEKISMLAKSFGGKIVKNNEYPEWEYRKDSVLRTFMCDVYKKMYNAVPNTEVIHAGLECGIFASKIKDLDAVSFGPDIYDIHTPKERMSISSAERVWEFIKALLKCWNI